jgi:hypothetical protein
MIKNTLVLLVGGAALMGSMGCGAKTANDRWNEGGDTSAAVATCKPCDESRRVREAAAPSPSCNESAGDDEGRNVREGAAAQFAAKDKGLIPIRAVGPGGTTLELSTKGLAACWESEIKRARADIAKLPGSQQGIPAEDDSTRVYVFSVFSTVRAIPRAELATALAEGSRLASAEEVATERADHKCGARDVRCSALWLAFLVEKFSKGDDGKMMATFGFKRVACVGDEWSGSLPLEYQPKP